MNWFKKDVDKEITQKFGWLVSEITQLHMEIDKLRTKLEQTDIQMAFLQDKFKNKIFKKPTEEETTETNKKPSVFLNPYGNPI